MTDFSTETPTKSPTRAEAIEAAAQAVAKHWFSGYVYSTTPGTLGGDMLVLRDALALPATQIRGNA